jgi:L-asparaginase II
MGAMTKAPPVFARVYRGSGVESTHRGSVSVVDERGRTVASAGDDAAPIYLRSTAKPFQAMPLLLAGGEKRFRLGDPEIALMCASHAGEPRHTRVAEAILKRGGFRVGDLRCGAHAPASEAAAHALVASGKEPTPLHNNCSGKHAGLLLACRILDLPHAAYDEPGHPLHKRIKTLLARYADVAESSMGSAVDGCSLPVYRIPLSALAFAYARLVADRVAGEDRAVAAVRRRVVRAMIARPEMVAGEGRFTTDFIVAGRGRWIGKEGAEGVYAVGLAPAKGPAIGIAFKIEDGSLRARDAATLDILERLGELPEPIRRALVSYAEPRLTNAAGTDVGRIEAQVPLTRKAAGSSKRRAAAR